MVTKSYKFVLKVNRIHNFMSKSINQENVIPNLNIVNNLSDEKEKLILRNEHDKLCYLNNLINTENLNVETPKSSDNFHFYMPNDIDPSVKELKNIKVLKVSGEHKEVDNPQTCMDILCYRDLLTFSSSIRYLAKRNYYFISSVAKLERALVHLSIQKLLSRGIKIISVPDIINNKIVESTGMCTTGQRTQVYKLNSKFYGENWCLSGTAEIGIAVFLSNKNIPAHKLPLQLGAVSRCYRAEISHLASEKGIYRVHQFTKVEMFCVCLAHQSTSMLKSILEFQEHLYNLLGLQYQVIDIPPSDLSNQAYRQFDVEAWMCGSKKYGEIASCSNCTDYQSRRLNLKHENYFLHTLNGTVCAVPRMIISLVETYQSQGVVPIPEILLPYMAGINVIGSKRGPKLHDVKTVPIQLMPHFII